MAKRRTFREVAQVDLLVGEEGLEQDVCKRVAVHGGSVALGQHGRALHNLHNAPGRAAALNARFTHKRAQLTAFKAMRPTHCSVY